MMAEDRGGSSFGDNNTMSGPSSSSSSSSSSHRLYPGFLSTEDETSESLSSPSFSTSATATSPRSSPRKSPPAGLHLPLALPTASGSGSGAQHRILGLYSPAPSARSLGKRRPAPLHLADTPNVSVDEELTEQREIDSPLTGVTVVDDSSDSLQEEMADLSLLRHSIRQNMIAQPVESPLSTSESGFRSQHVSVPNGSLTDRESISVDAVVEILKATSPSDGRIPLAQTLVLDTRPLGDFLESHLPRSANVSIPSLIFKRFRNASKGSTASLGSLGSFVTTPAGRQVWDGLNGSRQAGIFVLGSSANDETAKVLRRVMEGLVEGHVRLIQGGWASLASNPKARELLVQGEQSNKAQSRPPKTASGVTLPSPPGPNEMGSRITRHPSLPSLRHSKKPNLPTLTINGTKRPPELSLNLDRRVRPDDDDDEMDGEGLSVASPHILGLKTPQGSSFQAVCHAQSKLPPSPSSFGGVSRSTSNEISLNSPSLPGHSQWTTATARPRHGPLSAVPPTARSGGMAPFIVSTILPNFLYLGPEISSNDDVEELERLGVKRILNVALECDNEDLKLPERFERYLKLPMRDIVEESGVGKGMRDACDFLDDARLHSAPTYVHCKAGKSRSVTVVLAYLIHANAWPLKTAYAYVAERRKGISPNIGFVAELMQFEETELGVRHSGGVHGETKEEKPKPQVRLRDSMPPAWVASSMDETPKRAVGGDEADEEHRKAVGDEREVRKNGQWVHQRRAPFDRTTLQPGRRVSKAGLESLLGFSAAGLTRASPKPSPGLLDGGDKPLTPGGEGRIGWV